jgi:hypothetical protein
MLLYAQVAQLFYVRKPCRIFILVTKISFKQNKQGTLPLKYQKSARPQDLQLLQLRDGPFRI